MNRRHLLKTLCAGTTVLSGCSGGPSEPTSSSNSEPPSPDMSSPEPGDSGSPEKPSLIYVSPHGSSAGEGTQDDPLGSISEAVRRAAPGETVQVKPGAYREEIHTQRGGEPGSPITIAGPRDAVVRPTLEDGRAREGAILNLNHSHVHLRGLTIDGLADPDREGEIDWYGDVISVFPDDPGMEYLRDIVVMPHAVGNSRQALVSLVRVIGAEVGGFEVIGPAGVQHLHGDEDGHNGEIVYLGTAIDNIMADWYGWNTIDETRNVHVHHINNSAGYPHAELVDAKPGTRDIVIEYCSDLGGSGAYTLPGHDDTDEAAVGLRGRDATLRWSVIKDGHGQAVQVGSWNPYYQEDEFLDKAGEEYPEEALDLEAGTDNAIYHNRLIGNAGLAIRFQTDRNQEIIAEYGPDAQRRICGNEYDGETHGDPDIECGGVGSADDGIGHTGGDSSPQRLTRRSSPGAGSQRP